MRSEDIRAKFLEFFKNRGHAVLPSASLVPENDPTTLFTGSGMQPLLPYLLGEAHPEGNRLVNSQKSFRAEDIEEIGDNRHTTFFEMLGNWSFGDYFKKEQLRWFFEFLTEEAGLDPNRIYVTAFIGDEKAGISKDTETAALWKQLFQEKGIIAKEVDIGSEEDGYLKGMSGGRIFFYGKKNWWNRGKQSPETTPVGDPAGPDSEVFYDFGTEHDTKWGEQCHPNCDCGRFMEVGNSVFMQYQKQADGSFKELPKKNVDFGGGLERIVAAANNDPDIFQIDVFQSLINTIKSLSKSSAARYVEGSSRQRSFRIICDHIRAAVFLTSDGVTPSYTEQGYVLRRLLRRAIRRLDALEVPEEKLSVLVDVICEHYRGSYPDLLNKKEEINDIFSDEEKIFRKTLAQGLNKFNKLVLITDVISGKDAFILFTTYGLPLEMIEELAEEKGVSVDTKGFQKEMEKHQALSRAGAEKKFKGGLADTSEMSVKYHTATHLLHKALRDVLGEHVFQKGSNITPERLRFDFSHPQKMTPEEIKKVEELGNAKIQDALPVSYEDIPLEEAKKRGAIGLFEEKYGDKVRVYQIGEGGEKYSVEFCGGPHVKNTSELDQFKILKEEAVAQGIRRIKAVLE